jgi:outer membrane protein OmpA-like peptidoglycan-associated protein
MLDYLNKYPEIKLAIEGHTDNVGKPEFNQELSQKRAEAVKAAIVKKGISEDRISAKGFGMDQPIDDNKTAAGKAKNRRVEFKFSQ